MNNQLIGLNDKGLFSGFYYDIQKAKSDTSITLHANTELGVDGKTWVAWGDNKGSNSLSQRLNKLYNILNNKKVDTILYLKAITKPKGGELPINWSSKYGATPIASSILNEDFQFAINNTWSDVSGNNNIEDFWKTLLQSSGMIRYFSNVAGKAIDKATDGATSLLKFGNKFSDTLNKSLVIQGNRFAIYLGTNTDFLNLSMKFTIFSDWEINPYFDISHPNLRKKYRFVSCTEKLNDLYPYFLGVYENLKGEDLKKLYDDLKDDVSKLSKNHTWLRGVLDVMDSDTVNLIVDGSADGLSEVFGWQNPPAGFITETKNIDNCQKGTFRLVFGGRYAIENVIGTSMNVTLSKTIVKAPDYEGSAGIKFYPQSADVVLNFKCASSFSNNILKSFTELTGALVDYGTDSGNQYLNADSGEIDTLPDLVEAVDDNDWELFEKLNKICSEN